MGVTGLTTYVEGNRQFFTDLKLKNSNLVIDGCSLYYRLYFSSQIDQKRGGDYDVFASLLRSFFGALRSCNIQPFVVVDGGMDPTDKKFKTLCDRTQSKIREAHSLSLGSRGNVLPILSRQVFKQVVNELGIPLLQCISEADFEIASLAHQWKCPVLTSDSDFYIFDLPGGYLPMAYFEWENVCRHGAECHILARRFTVNRFCSHFNHMNKQLLPLLAVIIGNDYTPPKITEAFFSRVELQRIPRGRGHSNPRIDGLLRWLSMFTSPIEALEEVLEILGGKHKGSIRKQLTTGVQDYQLPPTSSLALIFLNSQPGLLNILKIPVALESQPEWLLREFTFCRLSPMIFDILILQKAILIAQVENSQLPSSHEASSSIRQVIYGLLLSKKAVQSSVVHGQRGRGRGGTGRGGLTGQSQMSGSLCLVEEYDRLNLNLTRNTVVAQLPSSLPQLNLDTLDKTAHPVRLKVLLGTLGVMEHLLQPLPPHLHLLVCVTLFWVRMSKPKPSHTTLQALMIGLVYGELCRRSTMTGDPLYSCALTASVCQQLNKFRINTGQRRGLDLIVAHSLSQWQSCLLAGIYLNQVLCLPLPEPQCAWLFSGTLLHGLEPVLRGGNHAEALLAGSHVALQLYSILFEAILGSGVQHHAAQHTANGRQRRQGKSQQGGRGRGRGNRRTKSMNATSNLTNRFGILSVDDECDED